LFLLLLLLLLLLFLLFFSRTSSRAECIRLTSSLEVIRIIHCLQGSAPCTHQNIITGGTASRTCAASTLDGNGCVVALLSNRWWPRPPLELPSLLLLAKDAHDLVVERRLSEARVAQHARFHDLHAHAKKPQTNPHAMPSTSIDEC